MGKIESLTSVARTPSFKFGTALLCQLGQIIPFSCRVQKMRILIIPALPTPQSELGNQMWYQMQRGLVNCWSGQWRFDLAQCPFLGCSPFPPATCALGADGSSLLQPNLGDRQALQAWPVRPHVNCFGKRHRCKGGNKTVWQGFKY